MASGATNTGAAAVKRKKAAAHGPRRRPRPQDTATLEAVEAEAAEVDAVELEEERTAAEPAPAPPAPVLATSRLFVDAPPPAPRRRRRTPSLGMLFALCGYLGAILVVVTLASPVRESGVGLGLLPGGGAAAGPGLADMGGDDALALRTQAARISRSTVVVDTRFTRGTGFVAWTIQGNSFVITALPVVQGVLAEGEESVFVRRGQRFWNGRIERVDEVNQLALVVVESDLGSPVWQQRHGDQLADGDLAAIVRGGDIGSVQGTVAGVGQDRPTVTAVGDPMNLGAPIVGPGGSVVAVVVGGESGRASVVPLERACGDIRRCA